MYNQQFQLIKVMWVVSVLSLKPYMGKKVHYGLNTRKCTYIQVLVLIYFQPSCNVFHEYKQKGKRRLISFTTEGLTLQLSVMKIQLFLLLNPASRLLILLKKFPCNKYDFYRHVKLQTKPRTIYHE